MVVNGTCADDIRGSCQRESEALVRAVWGSQWLNFFNDREATVQATAQRWADVLVNGGDVWVAKGGRLRGYSEWQWWRYWFSGFTQKLFILRRNGSIE